MRQWKFGRLLRLKPGVNSHSAFYTSSPGESAHSSHPHFTLQPAAPHHSLPSRAPPLACEHHDLPLLWILKVQLGLFLVFLTFLPNIQLSCCLFTYCPALTHPSMPPPSPSHLSHPQNLMCSIISRTHFLRNLRDCSLTFGGG